MAAVAPVLGVVSTLSGLASSNSQAKAQRDSVRASNLANEAQYANTKAQLQARQQYADYEAALSTIQNQGLLVQQQLGLEYSSVIDNMTAAQQGFQNQQQLALQEMTAVGEKSAAENQKFQSNQQALGTKAQASAQNQQTQAQIANQANEAGVAVEYGMDAAASQRGMASALMGNNAYMSTSANEMQTREENIALQRAQQQQQALAQGTSVAQQQLGYANTIADQTNAIGLFNAGVASSNADSSLSYNRGVNSFNQQAIAAEQVRQQQASNAARVSLQGASNLDALTNRANQITATQGISSQANAAASQFGSQQAALQSQASQIKGASLMQYAQAGLGIYGAFNNALGSRTNNNPLQATQPQLMQGAPLQHETNSRHPSRSPAGKYSGLLGTYG